MAAKKSKPKAASRAKKSKPKSSSKSAKPKARAASKPKKATSSATKAGKRKVASAATKKPTARTASSKAKTPVEPKSAAISKPAAPQIPPPKLIDRSLLPTLEWNQQHWYCWYGTERLPAWSGLRFYSTWMKRTPKPDDGTVDISVPTEGDGPSEPTASQLATYRYLKDNERALASAVLSKILETYPQEKQAYEESVGEGWPALPEVTNVEGLSAVIGPPTIHILDNRNEPGAVGEICFAFDCAWDEEHQLGVRTWNGEVLEIGDGSVAGHIRE